VYPFFNPASLGSQTSATFLRIVGSELIQKYLGDGPKLVRILLVIWKPRAASELREISGPRDVPSR
jgi:ATP-dependent 26S proteasome regulatory subunit